MPFVHLSQEIELRAQSAVVGTVNVDFVIGDTQALGMEFAVKVAGRTQGTVTVQLKGSLDGGTTYSGLGSSYTLTALATNATSYLKPRDVLPRFLRFLLVQNSSFDGTVGLFFRTSSGLPV